nr:hypothetical protein GCM10020093_085250 [Planobispora longispora]
MSLMDAKPDDSLMVGDSLVSDGGCAREAGVDFCLVDRTGGARLPDASDIPVHWTVTDLGVMWWSISMSVSIDVSADLPADVPADMPTTSP